MTAIAGLGLLLSALTCYAIGYAVIAPREAFLRTKTGVWILIAMGLSFVPLPPQILSLDSAAASLGAVSGELAASLAWPAGVSKAAYLWAWGISSACALLAGMRIWRAGKPDWRASAHANAYDTSKAGRLRALMVMADSLAETLDLMSRADIDAKTALALAEELRTAGRRFASQLPESSAEVYRMVSTTVGSAAASVTTGLLLEGAGRKSAESEPAR